MTPADLPAPTRPCQRCGAAYVVWYAPDALWRAHAGGWRFLCLNCFTTLANESDARPFGFPGGWVLHPIRFEPGTERQIDCPEMR